MREHRRIELCVLRVPLQRSHGGALERVRRLSRRRHGAPRVPALLLALVLSGCSEQVDAADDAPTEIRAAMAARTVYPAKREEWRQALNALKLALTLRDTPELRAQYDALREKYGFRVSNFSVDSDAASPRACFQFTKTLPKRTDFSPFVAVVGQDKPAI